MSDVTGLQAAVERLLALQSCRDLVVACTRAVDGLAYDALGDFFTEDATLVRPDGQRLEGREAIVGAYRRRDPDRLTRHLLSNHTVVWRDDRCIVSTCAVTLWSGRRTDAETAQGRPADPTQWVGAFDDELVQTGHGWRIRVRHGSFVFHHP